MTVALLACRGAVHADAPVKVRHTQASARRTSSRLKDSPLTATAAIATGKRNARTTPLASHGLPLLADGPLAPEWVGPQKARRPAHGPVSPVAPRRTAVAAVVRPADHGLPYVASLMSGVSYGACLRREYDEVKRCRRMLRWASRDLTDPCRFGRHRTQRPKQESPYAGIVGAPGWNRTSDTRFRKPVLYPLSYEGIMPICRDFPSAAARQEYHELRGSCQICGKPPNSPLSPTP